VVCSTCLSVNVVGGTLTTNLVFFDLFRRLAKSQLYGGLVEAGITNNPQILVVFLALVETLLQLGGGLLE